MKFCWKMLVPVYCAQKPNYFWNVPWNSGSPDSDQGNSTASPYPTPTPTPTPGSVCWLIYRICSLPSTIWSKGLSVPSNVCLLVRLFVYFLIFFFSNSGNAKESSGKAGASISSESNFLLIGCQDVRLFLRSFTWQKCKSKKGLLEQTKQNPPTYSGTELVCACWCSYPIIPRSVGAWNLLSASESLEEEEEGLLCWVFFSSGILGRDSEK